MTGKVEKRKLVLPPVYFLGAMASMVALHLFPLSRWLTWPSSAFGIVIMLGGLALIIFADAQFKHSGTTVKPFETSSALVTDGVFAYSRNPMYLGMIIVLIGLWICLGTVASILVVPVFAWLITERFIGVEEVLLRQQFGEVYDEYSSKTRRWL